MILLVAILAAGVVLQPDLEPAYRRIAASGNTTAQSALAWQLMSEGRQYEAQQWLRAAAKSRDAQAQIALGDFFLNGPTYTRDASMAASLYRAASRSSAEAMFKLGKLYEDGEGVDQSNKHALELYLRAAELGSAGAQNSLGNLSM